MQHLPRFVLLTTILIAVLSALAFPLALAAQSADLDQQLRDEYEGKMFVLRGFYSSAKLRYDSSGVPEKTAVGDWTDDGFVRITAIRLSDDRLIIKAQRMVVAWLQKKQFELHTSGEETRYVEIKVDSSMHNPAPEQVHALVSKIFLTSQDSLADLVPDFWKPCVRGGLKGVDENCVFSPELLAIPGVSASGDSSTEAPPSGDLHSLTGTIFRAGIGKDISPPRVTYQREPDFSASARGAKFQGTIGLMLVVDKDGVPRNIHISQPLGYGLDAKAVQAVESWKFKPAEKDGMPVNVEIAIQVEFHLY